MAALAVLSAACYLYYNIPVHSDSQSGATEYVWEPHTFYSRGTEGFACGKTNDEGLNNLLDRGVFPIDILVMGSSHMEAMQVPQAKTMTAYLNQMLNGEKYAYNIGISGHQLPYIASNLRTALTEYRPSQYLVIEVASVKFDENLLQQVAQGATPTIPSHDKGIIGALQQVPYLRLLYFQLKNLEEKNEEFEEPDSLAALSGQEPALNSVLLDISSTCAKENVTPIIFYHPHLLLDHDGVALSQPAEEISRFGELCDKNGILWIDMTDDFFTHFEQDHILPHGFSNTAVGVGHLNRHGHRWCAQAILDKIMEQETAL